MFHKLLSNLRPFCISSTFCSLSQNNISDSGACVLAETLKVNQCLQKLEWVQHIIRV